MKKLVNNDNELSNNRDDNINKLFDGINELPNGNINDLFVDEPVIIFNDTDWDF